MYLVYWTISTVADPSLLTGVILSFCLTFKYTPLSCLWVPPIRSCRSNLFINIIGESGRAGFVYGVDLGVQ